MVALGLGGIPELLRILNDDTLHVEDGPGAGWAQIHAVDLLADLKATESIEPMLQIARNEAPVDAGLVARAHNSSESCREVSDLEPDSGKASPPEQGDLRSIS